MAAPVFAGIFDPAVFGGSGGLFASQFDYTIFDEDAEDGVAPSIPQTPFAKSMVSDFMQSMTSFAS